MTFDGWLTEAADAAWHRPTGIRFGQFLFNHLYAVRPEIANKLRGDGPDPFHNDERVPDFLRFVEDNW